ncbi:MAG: carboxylating nicotinate-nucleotide diphosphorylase [Desulfovibrionaceae bacterium]
MSSLFSSFFSNPTAYAFLKQNILFALEEDGQDLTSQALFKKQSCTAKIVAKEKGILVGVRFIPLIFTCLTEMGYNADACALEALYDDGDCIEEGAIIAYIAGDVVPILKAERVILNYINHLSGIATKTSYYVHLLEGTGITLLDTRKTHPGLRYLEKYAVVAGGGKNHRKNLEEMIMIKDTHIDAVGSITKAVEKVRYTYAPCPYIVVETRTLLEVQECIVLSVNRILLDNMEDTVLVEALSCIPSTIETEISGGISLENIKRFSSLSIKPTFISVGELTHTVKQIDCSMYIVL